MNDHPRAARTRTRLVDAAIDVLAEVGYAGTTFVEVSKRTGLSRGAIHHTSTRCLIC